MSPKGKAKYLVDKFNELPADSVACAKFVAEEMLKELDQLAPMDLKNRWSKIFWRSVITELDKLL
jgi:hypothetical protein